MYFNEHSSGRHYIHFKTASSTNQVDWRIQTNSANTIIHSWSNTNALFRTNLETTGTVTATGGNSGNWNTAYGWGNHASAGYLTSETFGSSDVVLSLSGNDVTAGDSITLAGGLSYNSSTNTLSQTDNNTTYTVGDGGLTQKNFTTTLKTKLDGIAAGATNVTNNNQLTNGSGYITGISFANVSSKPAFSVNSMLSSRSTTAIDTVGDSNGVTFNYLSSSTTNKPGGNDASLMTMSYSNIWQTQLAQDWRNKGRMYLRGQNNGTWSSWIRVHSTDDFSTTDVANGVTAHGWGNHASAGYLTTHPSISSASSVNNSGRTYIQDITVDSNGHVTAINSATETVVNTDTTYSVGDGGLTQKNFTTTLKTKLDGIEANATADQTAAQILAAIKTVDGEGSGLDADTLDGLSSGSFFRSNTGNSTDVRFAAGDGRGVRFWDSDNYKIWMSAYNNGTWGGRLDTSSDYNMYFRMSGGTNRGFVFQNSTTEVMQIQSDGTILTANDGNSEQWNTAYGWGNHASGGYSTASGVEDNADVTDTTNVVAALTAGTNVQIAANGTISATDTNTVYTHPTSAGNKHIPTGGAAGQFLKYSSSGTATWATPSYTTNTNTTYTAGTGLTLTGTSFSVTANTYATAAQGSTADAALPKAGGTMTGDLVMADETINFATGGSTTLPQFTGLRSTTDLNDRSWSTQGGWAYTTFDSNSLVSNTPSTGLHNANGLLTFNTHTGSYMAQIAMTTNTQKLWTRARNGGGWLTWYQIFTSADFTAANVANGVTAHGWGNHASAGYSTASGVEDNADVTDTANVVAALTAGTNVQIAANGTISATDTNTQLTTAEVRGKVSGTGLIGYNSSTGVISTTANNYVHPTTAGNKHIPSGGSAGQFLKYSSSGTAVWAADNNTTYSNATTSASGLMSSTDKTKLNGIASGADLYTGWNFVDTSDTATRIDSLEYFKIAGSTISGTGTSADPYLVNTPDTDTNTWRPIDATPTNGATGDSISSDWAYDNVRNFSNGGNSLAGTFTATGDVVAYSDVRVKENIQDIDNALDKVTQLRGVKYNKIGSNEKSIGVIAQEIQKILPEVVREDQDGMLGVSYGNITAVLIEAIKEQQKQIDELKAQLNGITK